MGVQNITINDADGNELKGIMLFGEDLPKEDQTIFTITIPGDDK